MRRVPALPTEIAGIPVPTDEVSAATWRWAYRTLPDYLLTHSVRAYCWAAAIGAGEGWSFDRQLLWTANLMHDVGLSRLAPNSTCFEVEGAEIARRFLEGEGMPPERADTVAVAIVLHMQPGVTPADGVEAVLLDRLHRARRPRRRVRACGRGQSRGDARVPAPGVRPSLPGGDHPRGGARSTCQSVRLLHASHLADSMAASPWASDGT